MTASWKPEVITDSTGEWYGNALRFRTEAEALQSASDLASRWTLVRDWRAAPSADEPNYEIVDNVLTRIEDTNQVEYATDKHEIEVKEKRTSIRSLGSANVHRADGYGRKVAVGYMVRLDGRGPWRRVYCTIFSNIGSLWITFEKGKLFFHDWDLDKETPHITGVKRFEAGAEKTRCVDCDGPVDIGAWGNGRCQICHNYAQSNEGAA